MPRLQRQNAKYDETLAQCDDDAKRNEPGSIDEVIFRMKKFNDFSGRTERGSSKTLCSFVPVIEFIFLFFLFFIIF